jgi:hypothetical protein
MYWDDKWSKHWTPMVERGITKDGSFYFIKRVGPARDPE